MITPFGPHLFFIFLSSKVCFSTVKNTVYLDSLKCTKTFLRTQILAPLLDTWHILTQTHQQVAEALVVKYFALIGLSQLFAQFDGLLPHLQKKKSRVTSREQSSHWSVCESHGRVADNGSWVRWVDFCTYSHHASPLGSTKPFLLTW